MPRRRATAARLAHNQEVEGSNPSAAKMDHETRHGALPREPRTERRNGMKLLDKILIGVFAAGFGLIQAKLFIDIFWWLKR